MPAGTPQLPFGYAEMGDEPISRPQNLTLHVAHRHLDLSAGGFADRQRPFLAQLLTPQNTISHSQNVVLDGPLPSRPVGGHASLNCQGLKKQQQQQQPQQQQQQPLCGGGGHHIGSFGSSEVERQQQLHNFRSLKLGVWMLYSQSDPRPKYQDITNNSGHV